MDLNPEVQFYWDSSQSPKYQGGATWVDQEVEDGEEPVLLEQDQGGADCLQEPVNHVESHRDQIPCPPGYQSWETKTRGPSVLVTLEPRYRMVF